MPLPSSWLREQQLSFLWWEAGGLGGPVTLTDAVNVFPASGNPVQKKCHAAVHKPVSCGQQPGSSAVSLRPLHAYPSFLGSKLAEYS